MRDSIKRTLRTAVQLGAGETIVRVLDAFHPFTTDQHVALVGLLTLTLTMALNFLEESQVIPTLVK